MAFGPRPEPPPVPRKEPRNTRHSTYFDDLTYKSMPPKPPKVPVFEPDPPDLMVNPYLPSSPSSISSVSSISSSPSRLKGPRPLPLPRQALPTDFIRHPEPQGLQTPSFASMEDARSSAPYAAPEIMPMPEPVQGNDFDFSSVNTPSPHSVGPNAAMASFIPPPLVGNASYQRPTRSIFQWGIPAELLPPMPVPVDAMSGLKAGSGGQYTMHIDLPQLPPMDPFRAKFSVEQLTIADFAKVDEVWSIASLANWLYDLVITYDADTTVEDLQQALTRLFLYRINTLEWSQAEEFSCAVINSLVAQQFISSSSNKQCVFRRTGPPVSGVLTPLSGSMGCFSLSSPAAQSNHTFCYSTTCLKEPRQRQELLFARRDSNSIQSNALTVPKDEWGTNSWRGKRTNTGMSRASRFTQISTTTTANIPLHDHQDYQHEHKHEYQDEHAHEHTKDQTQYTQPALDPTPEHWIHAIHELDPLIPLEMNWRKYWNLDEHDVANVDPQLVKLQFAIHELIMSEALYVRDLQIYVDVYGEIELLQGMSVMSRQDEFCRRVFDTVRAVLQTNQRLLARLFDRQQRQGPYVHEVTDLVREWALEPETISAYTEYSDSYLWADNHIRRELSQSTRLQKWMEERAKDPRLTGRPHSFFFHRILPRVARYHLLLSAIHKYSESLQMSNECQIIEQAIQASNNLTQKCDDCVAKQKRVLDVQNLKAHIVFKSGAVTADLKLGDKRRRLIRRGDMTRRGDLKMDWVETHTLLLDNFLVLSKTREGMNGTAFYVTKAPIPLDLLVLESYEEEPVVKVSSKIAFTRHGPANADEVEPSSPENEKTPAMYPLKVTHLGSGGQRYVLFVPTRPERTQWAQSIIEAKQNRAQLAFTRAAEPFRLVKISDQFAYPEHETPQLPVPIPDTPLHRAVGEVNNEATPRVELRRKVNCITPVGSLYLMGTDSGLWIGVRNVCSTEEKVGPTQILPDPIPQISWSRALTVPQRILKIECVDTMNAIFVLCGDHNLTCFPLDQTVSRSLGDQRSTIGVRLNRAKKVIDFAVAYHRGRVTVIYLQQGGVLKVVEPIRSHGAVSMRNLHKYGLQPASSCIDSIREVDRMQANPDTTRITVFLKSLVMTTSKSFEWSNLDTKQINRIPTGSNTKEMQYWVRPIKLIKMDAVRVLMCYESCYVICDVSGNVGIQPTTWFLDKCSECAYYAPYLIVVAQGGELLEIRYVDEFPGRLVQIITGKDIKLLSNGDESVFIRMAHPWVEGRQLLLQLLGNETVNDNQSTWQSSSTN